MSVVWPLRDVSEVAEYVFIGYMFFTVFCCLNIVTAIFVDNAQALRKQDEETVHLEARKEHVRWIKEVAKLFMRVSDEKGLFTMEHFCEICTEDFQVQTCFRHLGIDLTKINAY